MGGVMKVIYFTFLVIFLSAGKLYAGGTAGSLTCSAGYKKIWIQSGRTSTPTCVLDEAAMSSPSMNRELTRAPITETSTSPQNSALAAKSRASATATKKPSAQKSSATKSDEKVVNSQPCKGDEVQICTDQACECQSRANSPGGSSNAKSDEGTGDANDKVCDANQVWSFATESCVLDHTAENRNCKDKGGVWNPNKNECLTKESCETKGGTWDSDTQDCEEKSNATSSTDSNQCKQRFEQMKDRCIDEASSAMTSCNDNNEEIQAAENTAKLIGAGSVTSMQVACSKIGELSKVANGALVGWKAFCSTKQGGCTESCNQAKEILFSGCIEKTTQEALIAEHYNTITGNINQCESYKQKIAQATQHAAAALAQLKASEQCKKDTSSLVNNAVDQCKANPNSPLCTDLQKCSDATFASQNAVCACVSNPTSPACLQASANYGGGASSTGATLPGVSGGKNGSGLPGLAGNSNDGSGSNSGAGSAGSPASDGHGVGGRQGDASSAGNLKNGAGGGAAGSGNHYAGGAGKDPLKVNNGTLGGAAGGPGYFGRTPTATGAYGTNAINGNKGTLAKFDPRKYITGLGGQREYINLANQNIFMIVKMRYEDKKTSLLPENFNLKK